MKRTAKTIVLALMMLGLLGLAACGQVLPGEKSGETPLRTDVSEPAPVYGEITVSGSGTVRLTPDRANVSLGISTQDLDPELTQNVNSTIVARVLEVLKERGVAEKDIRTTGYYMYPQYDYSYGGDRQLLGYLVETTLTLQNQPLDGLGSLLSACVDAGANNVNNVYFQCSGYDAAYRQALTQAVEGARDKAQTLAAAEGKTLGEIVTLVEGWQDTSARSGIYVDASLSGGEGEPRAMGAVLQPGETEVNATVTVTFRVEG